MHGRQWARRAVPAPAVRRKRCPTPRRPSTGPAWRSMWRYVSAHGRHDGAAGDDIESLARMPEVGIGNRLASLLDRADRQEPQPLRFDQFLKKRIREDGRAMAARLERQPERDRRGARRRRCRSWEGARQVNWHQCWHPARESRAKVNTVRGSTKGWSDAIRIDSGSRDVEPCRHGVSSDAAVATAAACRIGVDRGDSGSARSHQARRHWPIWLSARLGGSRGHRGCTARQRGFHGVSRSGSGPA